MLNTLGVYPLVAGGSPATSPICRCALASRVNESISSTTSRPPARKYSATVPEERARIHFGVRRRDATGLYPEQRHLIARADDNHGSFESLGAEVLLYEVTHLAATLPDQRDDRHVGRRVAPDHAQQDALANPAA